MTALWRALLLSFLLVSTVFVGEASANHEPACTSRGNAGNNSAQYNGSAPDVVADDSQGKGGDKVHMHGCGYNPSSAVKFELHSETMSLGQTTTDGNGTFDVDLTIPSNAPLGRHTITASGTAANGQPKVESVSYTVVPAAAANNRSARTLPRTGSDSSTVPLIAGSTVLIGAGAVLVIAARRRREHVG
jgi:LPXTG-motif cell wall-anchored protein